MNQPVTETYSSITRYKRIRSPPTMPTGTYGFKQWDELNDEARDELEEELMSQMAYELDRVFYRAVNDWLGDFVDAFNIPRYTAEDMCVALIGVWFEQNAHLAEEGADLSDLVDMKLQELENDGPSDLTEELSKRRG